jgi:hypothetical protein
MTRILKTLSTTFIVSAALIAPVSAQYAPGILRPALRVCPGLRPACCSQSLLSGSACLSVWWRWLGAGTHF